MSNEAFIERAKTRTLELFHAYNHDNDMEKVLSYFSKTSCLVGWGEQELYFDYAAIFNTMHERMTMPYFLEMGNIQLDAISISPSFCVIMLTANIAYHVDANNTIPELERASVVFRNEDGEAKVVYLHLSAANKLHSLGKIIPFEHGVEVTKKLARLECDHSMAVDMCQHTPNGLLYCLIDEHFPFIYANQRMCELVGCTDFADFLEYTKGEADRIIYQGDLQRVRKALLSHTDGIPYTINYRLVTKQGKLQWVMGRGQYVTDADTEEAYYVRSVTPLETEQQDFAYGNLVDNSYINNAPLSTALFLEQTLEYNDFNNLAASCQRMLQHCCETLQASCGVISLIHDDSKWIEPIYYFDKDNFPIDNILSQYYWHHISKYFTADGFSLCTDFNNVPNCEAYNLSPDTLRSGISKTIAIRGNTQYLITILHRGKVHTWTEYEQDIVLQTSKLLGLLLDEKF